MDFHFFQTIIPVLEIRSYMGFVIDGTLSFREGV